MTEHENNVDRVVDLWRDAKQLEHDAYVLETEAKSLRARAEDKYDEAEAIWKPIAEAFPAWRDAFIETRDPRDPEDIAHSEHWQQRDAIDGGHSDR